jgi:hypothetical protein
MRQERGVAWIGISQQFRLYTYAFILLSLRVCCQNKQGVPLRLFKPVTGM